MEFIVLGILLLLVWIGINYAMTYLLAPFWWDKERIKRACQMSVIFTFIGAIIFTQIFDENDWTLIVLYHFAHIFYFEDKIKWILTNKRIGTIGFDIQKQNRLTRMHTWVNWKFFLESLIGMILTIEAASHLFWFHFLRNTFYHLGSFFVSPIKNSFYLFVY